MSSMPYIAIYPTDTSQRPHCYQYFARPNLRADWILENREQDHESYGRLSYDLMLI
jgi:hypothetical protein